GKSAAVAAGAYGAAHPLSRVNPARPAPSRSEARASPRSWSFAASRRTLALSADNARPEIRGLARRAPLLGTHSSQRVSIWGRSDVCRLPYKRKGERRAGTWLFHSLQPLPALRIADNLQHHRAGHVWKPAYRAAPMRA